MNVKMVNIFHNLKKLLCKIKQNRLFYYILFLLFQWSSYFTLGKIAKIYSFNLWSPEWIIDTHIPFLSFMVIPYLFYNPLLVTPLFLSLKKYHLNRLAGQLFSASLINYLFSIIISTEVSPRVSIVDSKNLFLFLLNQIYKIDADALLFPSMHVMHPLLISLYLLKIKHPLRWTILVSSIVLALSIVFVKQHFFLDLIAGIVCAVVIYYISSGFYTHSSCKTVHYT